MRNLLILSFIACMLVAVITLPASAQNLPRSKAATLIEATSPTEALVRATGIGHWKKGDTKKDKDYENFLLSEALDDARRSAVYFIILGGSDPLLATDPEKTAFAGVQDRFFAIDYIRSFIAWESPDLATRTKRTITEKKEYELTIEKDFKINKEAITNWLVTNKILVPRSDLAAEIGNPVIMVLPTVEKGKNPIETMQKDENLVHAARVIESHLTAKQYEVIVPEQMVDLNELSAAQQSLKDVEGDNSYLLALSIGSDVYITYDVAVSDEQYGARKAVVNVRAYETTTARLLGTETGYSPSAKANDMALIENAVNDAIDKVLSRIMNYWKSDVNQGIQYKLIISISTGFDEDQSEEISFAFADALDEITKGGKYKENIVTDQTLDYLIWCDPGDYKQSSKVYREIKKVFSEKFPDGDVKKINLNRKLILLKVEAL